MTITFDVLSAAPAGGIYIGRSNFDLYNSTFFGNIAYYGGAAFISADFSGSSLSLINMINNDAVLGSAAYWCAHDAACGAVQSGVCSLRANLCLHGSSVLCL